MSLDVWLTVPENEREYFPCPHCEGTGKMCKDTELFEANITHNLNTMAEAVGIYKHLWRPEEIGITKAKQLIEPLKEALAKLKANPEEYEKYNAPNGWGLYKHFVPWVEKYLDACIQYPEADIGVSR